MTTLVKNQTKTFTKELPNGDVIVAEVRHDDKCGNGHNTFAITGCLYDRGHIRGEDHVVNSKEKRRYLGSCGCLHQDIAQHFPELAPLLKWHLCGTDGPLHYLANTLSHAGDRDCWGNRKGEPCRFQTVVSFGPNPIQHPLKSEFSRFLKDAQVDGFDLEVIGIDHNDRETYGTKYTFGGFADRWHECPFSTEDKALNFLFALQNCDPKFTEFATAWGKGSEPDLEAARRSAIWPDATLEQLNDKQSLEDRLPALLAEFREAVESLGFVY